MASSRIQLIGFGAERLMRLLGSGGLHVVTRVLGILLSDLAVQFVLNGMSEFVRCSSKVAARAKRGKWSPLFSAF